MTDKTFINIPSIEEKIRQMINNEMINIAEPLIQDAVAKIAREMRFKLGENLIKIIDSEYELYTDERIIRIEFNKRAKE